MKVKKLNSSDICRGFLSDGYGRHCLSGWLKNQFKGKEWDNADQIVSSMCGGLITVFNDDTTNSEKEIAELWNKAMINLGHKLI